MVLLFFQERCVVSLAIIGDVHGAWDDSDAEFFNHSTHDAVVFVGDFVHYSQVELLPTIRKIQSLKKPVYFIPGNHDTPALSQLLGELWGSEILCRIGVKGQLERFRLLQKQCSPIVLCAYSRHEIHPSLEMVAARPFSMGGGLNFKALLQEEYGVGNLRESADAIYKLVLETKKPYLILAHHGPKGLGGLSHDLFGADFLPEGGDWGDEDLAEAIAQAKEKGKAPLAVVAGHMHYPTRQKDKVRRWFLEKDGILFVNAARVPRIFSYNGRKWHHFVELRVFPEGKKCEVSAFYRSYDFLVEQKDPYAYLPS
ncbi:MAG: metallophosphoesterase [Leptospiraceae bacterium]|nr:metallophosphoesterase [Leptospiraceae bacterium]MDW8306647.1 metallophosphoesterase [Leptospiraceae bacterium]